MGRYELHHGNDLLLGNAGVPFHDILYRGTTGKVAEEHTDRQPRTSKHPLSAELSRTAFRSRTLCPINHTGNIT